MKNTATKNRKKFRTDVSLVILFTILVLYTLSLLVPTIWTITTSFKDYKVYMLGTVRKDLSRMIGFNNLTFDNFVTAFKSFSIPTNSGDVYLAEMFLNSILYSGGCAIVATIVPCVMAYLVARYDYKFGKIVYGIVLVTMAIPIVGALPSEIKMMTSLGLMDSVIGLYVLKANFLGIYFLVFYAQFKGIPKDYTEAASIDGAGEWRIMCQIIFPVAIGTISTIVLLNFIAFWNDYQTPMIYWEPRPVVAYGMYYFARLTSGKNGISSTPVKLASMIIVAIPIIIIFLIFNKKIMANMSIGGIKG